MNSLHVWTVLIVGFFSRLGSGCGPDSREVGNCLHTYLERDFPAIEAIVYPEKNKNRDKTRLLLDGPELEDQCKRLSDVVACLEQLLHTCYYYKEFFSFRNLVSSLRKSIDWTCQDLRGRFRVLLSEFHCLEAARLKNLSPGDPCHHHDLQYANIWQRIVRQQMDTEVCGPLKHQTACLLSRGYLNECDKESRIVYQNLTNIFTNKWCSNRGRSIIYSNSFITSLLFVFITMIMSTISTSYQWCE